MQALSLDDRGDILVAFGSYDTLLLARLRDDGSTDPSFGTGGSTAIPDWVAVAGDARGGMLVVVRRPGSTTANDLLRFVDGRPDAAFGNAGAVALARAYHSLAVGEDGSVFAGMAEAANQRATLRTVRLRPDGSVDTAYGSQGEALASFELDGDGGSSAPSLVVDAQGRLLVAAVNFGAYPFPTSSVRPAEVMLYRFTADLPVPPATATAIEYHHAGFDHYFVTADADEIAKLDAGVFETWTRTGESFPVLMQAGGGAMPVCRFFSHGTFAPRSSHFYTPYPAECDTVTAGPAWDFEKLAFFLTLPIGAGQGNGTCPNGSIALYRMFNAMRGGAPNHRYTTRASILDSMIASGWIMEGEANTRVFACVP
jgi:hypothetical protein